MNTILLSVRNFNGCPIHFNTIWRAVYFLDLLPSREVLKTEHEELYLSRLPKAAMYEKSFMHRDHVPARRSFPQTIDARGST